MYMRFLHVNRSYHLSERVPGFRSQPCTIEEDDSVDVIQGQEQDEEAKGRI
jgi:hypothetical protein